MQRPVSLRATQPPLDVAPARRSLRLRPPLWLLWPVLLWLLIGSAVYQLPAQTVLAVGSLGDQVAIHFSQAQDAFSTEQGLWYPDEQDRGMRYRWTRQQATITFNDWGGGPGTLDLSVAGWPGTGTHQPTVTVLADGNLIGSFTPGAEYAEVSLDLPAAPRANRVIQLQSSQVLTSTATISDLRPKGVRVNQLTFRTAGGIPLPVGGGTLLALAFVPLLGTLVTARRSRQHSVPLLFGTGLAVVLATALQASRLWVPALVPLLLSLTIGLVLLAEQRTLRSFVRAWRWRWAWSNALDYGLLATVILAAVSITALAIGQLSLPTLAAIQEDVEWLVALVPVGFGLVLLVMAGPTRLPRWLLQVRQQLIVGRLALVLLGVFLAIWLGWEFNVLATVPLVGHADYADNAVVARNLLRGHGWQVDYVSQFYALRPNGSVYQPQPTWPLLQPLLIAPWMAILGPTALAARMPNLVFNLALALLIFQIGADVWDRRVGLLAAMLTLLNQLFFKLTLYATTDLAFVVWSMAALWLFFRAAEGASVVRSRYWWQRPVVRFALAGLFAGLMVLQKPSGGILVLGMGLWLLVRSVPQRRLPWRGILAWGTTSGLLVSLYILRNWLTFHRLFFSTESYDAWILFYEGPTKDAWRRIYNVYLGDPPNPTWILRWGWDRTLAKIAMQWQAALRYLLPPTGSLLKLPLTTVAVAGLLVQRRRQRALLGLVSLAGLGYVAFLVLYWHVYGEERYLLPFVPWLLLLAMSAVCQAFDRLALLNDGKWSALAGLLLTGMLLAGIAPHWRQIDTLLEPTGSDYWGAEWQPSLKTFSWLQQNTPEQAVVMSQVPWELAFHADRPGVMVPNEPLPTILGVAKYYHAQYLVVNSLSGFGTEASDALRSLLNPPADLEPGERIGNFTLLHRELATEGRRPVLVYRIPQDYAGAGPIQP